jgi:HSP20 family molecular chaperone IbpA
MSTMLDVRRASEYPLVPSLFDPFRSMLSFAGGRDLTQWGQGLVKSSLAEDGSTVLEYNLAGFAPEEIAVRLDTISGELMVTAEKADNTRRFSTAVSLPQYATMEDITPTYENGIMTVKVAPLEKRKEEAIVDIPFNKREVTT